MKNWRSTLAAGVLLAGVVLLGLTQTAPAGDY